jgi:hypothetical protein
MLRWGPRLVSFLAVLLVLGLGSCTKKEPVIAAMAHSAVAAPSSEPSGPGPAPSTVAIPAVAPAAAEKAPKEDSPPPAQEDPRPQAVPAAAAEPLPVTYSEPPRPSPPPFSQPSRRADFESALLSGSGVEDEEGSSALESWARAVEQAGALDELIRRFAAAAEARDAPPQVSLALAALYGRKGLIQKQYAALVDAEKAAKARPEIVFALAAVYGRKDTLKASYGADELLVGTLVVESEPRGARVIVDGSDRGEAPLSLERLREGKHRLRLETAGYEAWEAPFEIETGRETKLGARLGARPGAIEVIAKPAARVRLDEGDYEDAPHVYEGLLPGQHTLQFVALTYANRFYEGDGDMQVTLSPGQRSIIRKEFSPAHSKMSIQGAPKGSTLFLDGAVAGAADTASAFGEGLTMESGIYQAKIVAPNGQGWTQELRLYANAGSNTAVSAMCNILPRRSIKLDGKTDSWGDLLPVAEMAGGSFMGETACGIKRIYMCRDDRYLYWRVDFQGRNPLWKTPPGTKDGIQSTIIAPYTPGQHIDLSVFFDRQKNQIRTWYGISSDRGGNFQSLGNDIVYKGSDAMYVARLELAKMAKYLNAPLDVRIALAHTNGGKWTQESSSSRFNVDFSM